MRIMCCSPPLQKVSARHNELAELSLQKVDQLVSVRESVDVRWCHDENSDPGREGGGYLEVSASQIRGHTGHAVGGEQDAVVAAPLAEAVDEVRHLLTTAGVAPVLTLDKEKVRKKIEPLRVAGVP